MKKGMEKGMEKGRQEIVQSMLAKGLEPATIADLTGLSLEEMAAFGG